MINKNARFTMCICVVIFAIFCVSFGMKNINIKYKLDKSNDLDKKSAFFMSKIFVRRQLELPDSIAFPLFSEVLVKRVNDDTYQVMAGYSVNDGFGTIIHKQYICVLRYAGYNNWILENLDL